jgi:hypothetical protein
MISFIFYFCCIISFILYYNDINEDSKRISASIFLLTGIISVYLGYITWSPL